MVSEISSDNEVLLFREPDAHGQAAMLLVESLIHGLIEQKVISVASAVEIVDVATDVKRETGLEAGDSSATLQKIH